MVAVFSFEDGGWVVAPVTPWVNVVRGVIAIIEVETVGLMWMLACPFMTWDR